MKAARISGTENYAEEAPELLKRYESISFADAHGPVLHLIPPAPCHVLDIGAGTGRDAAGFATLGHSVVAVEPTEELRRGAMLLHSSPMIEWLDDSLPNLAAVRARSEEFHDVMLSAVWMHPDEAQRRMAMPSNIFRRCAIFRDCDRLAAFANGKQAILLPIFKLPGANVIQTVDSIKAALPQLLAAISPTVKLEVLSDRTQTIRASVADVQFTLMLTIALVVMVIFIFLRSLWATIIPSVAVPLALVKVISCPFAVLASDGSVRP